MNGSFLTFERFLNQYDYECVSKGKIKNFTSIDDPYEIPTSSDIVIDTTKQSILETLDYYEIHSTYFKNIVSN